MLAAACGADAVGFVFAPSPRRVTREVVSRITPYLPDHVDKFGVFVDSGFEEIASIVEECGLTGVQLHSVACCITPIDWKISSKPCGRIVESMLYLSIQRRQGPLAEPECSTIGSARAAALLRWRRTCA